MSSHARLGTLSPGRGGSATVRGRNVSDAAVDMPTKDSGIDALEHLRSALHAIAGAEGIAAAVASESLELLAAVEKHDPTVWDNEELVAQVAAFVSSVQEVDAAGDRNATEIQQLRKEVSRLRGELLREKTAVDSLMAKNKQAMLQAEMLWFRQVVIECEIEVVSRVLKLDPDTLADINMTSIAALEQKAANDTPMQESLNSMLQDVGLGDADALTAARRVKALGNGVAHVNIWVQEPEQIVKRLDTAIHTMLPMRVATRKGRTLLVSVADGELIKKCFKELFASADATHA